MQKWQTKFNVIFHSKKWYHFPVLDGLVRPLNISRLKRRLFLLFHNSQNILDKLEIFAIIQPASNIGGIMNNQETVTTTYIPNVRPGMRTSESFYREFGIGHQKVGDCFKRCIRDKKKNTFFLSSDVNHENPLELIQLIRKKGRPCLALHEAPEALEIFLKRFPEVQKLLDNRFVPVIRPGMRTAISFYKEFGIHPDRINTWFMILHKRKEQNTFFLNSDPKHKHPVDLVQQVKPKKVGGCKVCLALHEEGLEAFLKWLKDTVGIELKKRTTSPTVEPKLKARARFWKRRIPMSREQKTPEI